MPRTERPKVAKTTYTFKLADGQIEDLRAIFDDTGASVAEQIRRAVKLWIAKQRRAK